MAARRAVAGCFSLRTQGCGAAAAVESEARSAVLERGSGTCRRGSRPRAVVGKEHAGRGRCTTARPSPPPPPDPTSSCFVLKSQAASRTGSTEQTSILRRDAFQEHYNIIEEDHPCELLHRFRIEPLLKFPIRL